VGCLQLAARISRVVAWANANQKYLKALEGIERGIHKEQAAALRRAGEQLEAWVAQMGMLRNPIVEIAAVHHSSNPCPGGVPLMLAAPVAAWRGLAAAAKCLRCQLIVQREACGLFRHEDVDREYPIPTLPLSLTVIDVAEAP
jgi:hypothetical protein